MMEPSRRSSMPGSTARMGQGHGAHHQLTLKLFELSRTHSPHEQLIEVAMPLMRDLVDRVRLPSRLAAQR